MWIIDIDYIADKTASSGTNANAKGMKSRNYKEGCANYKFRLLDDDGQVYYAGRSDDDSSFAPLDCFGLPNAGCTVIQYWQSGNGGGWKNL